MKTTYQRCPAAMFDFQMSSIRSVSVVGAGEGEEVWEGLWGRRVGAGSWRMGKDWERGAEDLV